MMQYIKFYEIFDQLETNESKINFMRYCKDMHYPFNLEINLDFLIQKFYNEISDTFAIAAIFIECFGKDLICYQVSDEIILNIIDCIEIHYIEYPIEQQAYIFEILITFEQLMYFEEIYNNDQYWIL